MKKYLFLISLVYIFTGCEVSPFSSSGILEFEDDTAKVINDDNLTIIENNNTSIIDNFTIINKAKSKNDFYGYGKLNLSNLISEVTTFNSNITITKGELFPQQWAIDYDEDFYTTNDIDENASINPSSVYNNFTGNSVTVAVIDDGFDIYHPEIKDKIIAKIAFLDDGTTSSDVSHTYASDYHGTAVAGIIAANSDSDGINGIAPDVKLILIKMPDSISSSSIIDMFDYAVSYGADIVNCSWGTYSTSDAVTDKLNELSKTGRSGKGLLTVFASGNDDGYMEGDESAISGVIGVGATGYDNLRTLYSNYGKELDIVAPGGHYLGISTIDPLGNYGASRDEYNRFDEYKTREPSSFIGTSASAPVLSGALALLLEAKPDITFDETMDLLQKTSDKITQNLPYLDDMVSSTSNTPKISGYIPDGSPYQFYVKLVSNSTNEVFGNYSVIIEGTNWYTYITQSLPDDNYSVIVIDNQNNTLATDESFEIKK
ncbi:MAG: S8 family serine peptidase [Campylobacterota bacterium]|nr:S8 family serine peptidase [Campylobacterota bacterium]